ncbi:MAG: 50S ribosomal protein L31e [Candidatus Woesearchaeota archaeon]|jgi:large subunit ribosomal protein L31e|nr:50S ribosomal protein L31e [Candidatus Woesearchaeota archaeon]
MTELKREYVVPLRRKTKFAPKWRRSKKAICVLQEFIQKHMKTDSVIICPELNEKVWENGIKNPPGKVSVIALKTQIGGVEKTLVNLIEIGVDKHLDKYRSQEVQAVKEQKAEKPAKAAKTEETKTEVKNAEVKEVETKEEETEEVKKNG